MLKGLTRSSGHFLCSFFFGYLVWDVYVYLEDFGREMCKGHAVVVVSACWVMHTTLLYTSATCKPCKNEINNF
ncbi:hypothetical protein BJ742DRAFT_831605 [Cladochytrium replicatum]|nr:hypothetical protein BJ742DRAFT_831605 [Cladochytrium replicatum]